MERKWLSYCWGRRHTHRPLDIEVSASFLYCEFPIFDSVFVCFSDMLLHFIIISSFSLSPNKLIDWLIDWLIDCVCVSSFYYFYGPSAFNKSNDDDEYSSSTWSKGVSKQRTLHAAVTGQNAPINKSGRESAPEVSMLRLQRRRQRKKEDTTASGQKTRRRQRSTDGRTDERTNKKRRIGRAAERGEDESTIMWKYGG